MQNLPASDVQTLCSFLPPSHSVPWLFAEIWMSPTEIHCEDLWMEFKPVVLWHVVETLRLGLSRRRLGHWQCAQAGDKGTPTLPFSLASWTP